MKRKTWSNAELGTFQLDDEYGETRWKGTVDLPAFSEFRFRGSRPFRGSSRVPLVFASHDEVLEPSKPLVRLALKIVVNQEKIAKKIKAAFYDDILGKGPHSGMWWHNNEEARAFCGEVLAKRRKRREVESPDDFDVLLGEPAITIWDVTDPKPFARIDFGSAFEDEHGAEAITDGTKILGLGYQGDAAPYVKDRQ